MSDAESTLRFAITSGVTNGWDKGPYVISDEVFKKIFEPHLIWAITDYLKELNNNEDELVKAAKELIADIRSKPNDTRYATHIKRLEDVIKQLNTLGHER